MQNRSLRTLAQAASAVLMSILAVSCDVIDGPYREAGGGTVDTSTVAKRKILVEEFTGHKCGNCPAGAEKVEELLVVYPENVVAISIHSGFFARTDASYPADYRTPVGTQIDDYFGVSKAGNPNGLVNRMPFEGKIILGENAWAPAVESYLQSTPVATIEIQPSFNESSRVLSAVVTVRYLSDRAAIDNLALYVTEDSIISPQTDYRLPGDGKISNYVHRHVFRGSFNGAWGDAIPLDTLIAGESQKIPAKRGTTVVKTYQMTLPAGWNASKCAVVGLVSDNATNEVLQVEEKKIK